MTATYLQTAIASDIAKIFEGDLFKNSLGEYVPLNVYEQYLPIRKDEDEPDPVPYVIVRIEQGEVSGWTEAQEVRVTLLLGCFDDDTDNIGYKTVLGMIQKIEHRYLKDSMLDNRFMFFMDDGHGFEWALQEEESFPYYFGAINMNFRTAAVRKEDRFA